MAKSAAGERLSKLSKNVETVAKNIRTEVRKRAKAVPKDLQKAGDQLRKGAADALTSLEKYIHELRKNIEGAPAKKPATKTKARPKRAAKK